MNLVRIKKEKKSLTYFEMGYLDTEKTTPFFNTWNELIQELSVFSLKNLSIIHEHVFFSLSSGNEVSFQFPHSRMKNSWQNDYICVKQWNSKMVDSKFHSFSIKSCLKADKAKLIGTSEVLSQEQQPRL